LHYVGIDIRRHRC